ncbi:MAG: hypothetical protein ABIN11_00915 [candidate division WOR-3 bacterium]
MLAQVEIWEKENIQSLQSLAKNLEKEIKEIEQKLDRLLNAFFWMVQLRKIFILLKKKNSLKSKLPFCRKRLIWGERETIGLNH